MSNQIEIFPTDDSKLQTILLELMTKFNEAILLHANEIAECLDEEAVNVGNIVNDDKFIFNMYVREQVNELDEYSDEEIEDYNRLQRHRRISITHSDTVRLLREYIVIKKLTDEG